MGAYSTLIAGVGFSASAQLILKSIAIYPVWTLKLRYILQHFTMDDQTLGRLKAAARVLHS